MKYNKYNLTLTENQARVMKDALELYARAGMGQLDLIGDVHLRKPNKLDTESFIELRTLLHKCEKVITKLLGGGFFSISSDETPEDCRIAWDIYQVVRHRLAHDREPKGGWTVDFDKPMCYGGEELAEIKKVEE